MCLLMQFLEFFMAFEGIWAFSGPGFWPGAVAVLVLVVAAGGHSANKNSFIFIYCFTFPTGRLELQLPQCWKNSKEHKKSTQNQNGGEKKKCVRDALRRVAQRKVSVFFSRSFFSRVNFIYFLLPRSVHNFVDLSCRL